MTQETKTLMSYYDEKEKSMIRLKTVNFDEVPGKSYIRYRTKIIFFGFIPYTFSQKIPKGHLRKWIENLTYLIKD